MYLPPKSPVDYYDCILDDIEKIISVTSNVIIMGDLNLNCYNRTYNKFEAHDKVSHIENSFESTQVIQNPTRVTIDSVTLIDVIFLQQ